MRAILLVGLLTASNLLAQDVSLQKWGPIKFGKVENNNPAEKLVVGAEKAGGMRGIITRQRVGSVNIDQTSIHKNAVIDMDGVTLLSFRDGENLVIYMVVAADRVRSQPLQFGMNYSLSSLLGDTTTSLVSWSDLNIKVKTKFFFNDSTYPYTVRFMIPYTGSPAQKHILGQREMDDAILSVWYIGETADDYEDLWTNVTVFFTDLTPTQVKILPSGSSSASIFTTFDFGPENSVFLRIKREQHIRFFEITAGDQKWVAQLPFVPELNVYLVSFTMPLITEPSP